MNTIGLHRNDATTQAKKNPALVPVSYTHSICLGETGSGKTTGFIYPNLAHRIRLGHGILVYDFKGKEHFALKALAKKNKKLSKVIEIGKPYSDTINLLSYFSEKSFERLIKSITADDWWGNSATNLAMSVYHIIKIFSQFDTFFKEENLSFDWDIEVPFVKDTFQRTGNTTEYKMTYQPELTFEIFDAAVGNTFDFIVWLEGIELLIEELYEAMYENICEAHSRDDKEERKRSIIYIKLYNKLENEYSKLKNYRGLSLYPASDRSSSGVYGIFLSLNSVTKVLANKSFLNDGSNKAVNLIAQLEEGAIIVVNTASFSDNMLSIFTSSLLEELSLRSQQLHKHPVSIFIDEAQRVLRADTDVPLDILRESKVDLFLASQSEILLANAIGEDKWFALKSNITKYYQYRTHLLAAYKYLRTHEFFFEEKKYLSDARFFSAKVFQQCELLFQHQKKLQKKYNVSASSILIYDNTLYEKYNQLITVNIETGEQSKIQAQIKTQNTHHTVIESFMSIKESVIEKHKSFLDEQYEVKRRQLILEEYIDMDDD